jgi:hypothetical protein
MQVADLPEKCLVGIGVKRFALVVAMPLVNLRLQSVPLPKSRWFSGPSAAQMSATPCQK